MHIHVRSSAAARRMQKKSTRTDQTRPRNDYSTWPTLTGQGIRSNALRPLVRAGGTLKITPQVNTILALTNASQSRVRIS
eukprot:3426069-Prymnesium_polylepis.2